MGAIVVGFIDTPEGEAAVRAGIGEAQRRGSRLVVVNSLHGGARTSEEEIFAVRGAADRVRAQLDAEGVDGEVVEYVRGNSPARDLIAAAADFEAVLLVIGIRRRSTTGKIILGSNALEILYDADIPVLCVKA